MMDERIEAAAIVIAEKITYTRWENLPEQNQMEFRMIARMALAGADSVKAADAVAKNNVCPDGWKLMPVKASKEMLSVIYGTCNQYGECDWEPTEIEFNAAQEEYFTMLCAAPQPPEKDND